MSNELNPKFDERPQFGAWAPGEYFCLCRKCNDYYIGAKCSSVCADCAYGELAREELPNPPLLPCPFCGGPVELEPAVRLAQSVGWGVVCRNTINLGGTCCMEQTPSVTKKAAIERWNMRNGKR